MDSSFDTTVQPATFGGLGEQTGPYGGLQDVAFPVRCLPDIQRNTRIVAVCGIPPESASPQEDGWFFSDFFLFHQMLGHRSKNMPEYDLFNFDHYANMIAAELPNQVWLSCCSPRDLICKHGRYLHGPTNDKFGERRVVMNEAMLPDNEMKAGFRTCQPKDLLERFVVTLRQEFKEAVKTNQSILILVFGHGIKNTFEVYIGCGAGGKERLTMSMLESVLNKDVQTTLILTSCYSGGWVLMPNLTEYFQRKPRFNLTTITASQYEMESFSWPISQTIGRQAAGSVCATVLFQSLITTGDDKSFWKKDSSSTNEMQALEDAPTIQGLVLAKLDDEAEETQLTAAALFRQLQMRCEDLLGTAWKDHKLSFAAQDDQWANNWSTRTGLPTAGYKEVWESLPLAPKLQDIYPDTISLTGSFSSEARTALHSLVRYKAVIYMNSKPGPDNAGGNTPYHWQLRRIIEGEVLDMVKLEALFDILQYREHLINMAEVYCAYLGLSMQSHERADQFDIYEWYDSRRSSKLLAHTCALFPTVRTLHDRFDMIRGWVIHLDLFKGPPVGRNEYSKPHTYLAARLADSTMTLQEISTQLDGVLQCLS